MNVVTIEKQLDGTWTVDAGCTGQDGYKTKKHAQYAMSLACWGARIPTPEEVEKQIPENWQY